MSRHKKESRNDWKGGRWHLRCVNVGEMREKRLAHRFKYIKSQKLQANTDNGVNQE